MQNKTGVIKHIWNDVRKKRSLLYLRDVDTGYHAIAPIVAVNDLKVGDVIQYEPCGLNFGWFVAKKEKEEDKTKVYKISTERNVRVRI